MIIKKILITLFPCLLLFGVLEAVAAKTRQTTKPVKVEKQDNAALSSLKNILSPVSSIQGTFNQKVMNENGKVLNETDGRLWLKKPGQFRWEVHGKDKRLVVSDGKQVWDFDPELEQVTIQNLPKSKSSTPIYFLTGDVNSLGNDFSVKVLGTGTQCLKDSDTCFELTPKGQSSSFHWIKIGFLNNVLKEIELLDQLGQRSIFSFHKLSVNENISPKQFHFTPPKGVDIVRN